MFLVCVVGFALYSVADRVEKDIMRQYSFRLGNKIMNTIEFLVFALFLLFISLLPSDWFSFPHEATLEFFIGLGSLLN